MKSVVDVFLLTLEMFIPQTDWKKRSLLVCRFIRKDYRLEIYNVSRGHAYWIILASSTTSLNLTLSPIELCELIEVHPVVPKTDMPLEQRLLGRRLFRSEVANLVLCQF